jgi:serine protease Do
MGNTIRIAVLPGALALLLAVGLVPGRSRAADATEPPESFARVARAALAASIVVRRPDAVQPTATSASDLGREEFDPASVRRTRTLASGVIVDPRGLALVSARVLRLEPRVDVALADGMPLKADVVAVDWRTDVAVLRVHGEAPLPYLPFGDSARLRVGDWILAVGAPSGLEGTVTAGVVTAIPTPADPNPLASFIQTDAAIGRGFVGSPLVAMNGELVGLATALSGEGIGYVLPAATVRKVYVELLEKGRVTRPWLGVRMQRLSSDLARAFGTRAADGVLISDVLPESVAARAGLRSGDVILSIDGHAVSSRGQVDRTVSARSAGDTVRLKIRRATRDLVISVRLGEEPDAWEVDPDLLRARRLLGIEVRPVTPAMGAVVVDVDVDSPADLVGLEPGDVIREIDRTRIGNIAEFRVSARRIRSDREVLVLIQRGDAAVYVLIWSGPDE